VFAGGGTAAGRNGNGKTIVKRGWETRGVCKNTIFIIYKIQGDEGLTLIGRKAPTRGESVPSIVDGGYRNASTAAGKVTSALAVGEPDKMISGLPRTLFPPARIHFARCF
jgi:hypothetical protein